MTSRVEYDLTPAAVQGVVGRKVLEIHGEFVEEIVELRSVRAKWIHIERIEYDALRTWLIIAPLLVIVIPNSTFPSSQEHELFISECNAKIGKQ